MTKILHSSHCIILIKKANLYHSDVTDVVPNIRHVFIRGQSQCSFETVQCHVILLSEKTAQAKICEQFCIVYSHLEKTAVKGKSQLY